MKFHLTCEFNRVKPSLFDYKNNIKMLFRHKVGLSGANSTKMGINYIVEDFLYLQDGLEAHEQRINEAETFMRSGNFLADVLGYDVFSEVSKEYMVKDKYVDCAIKLNNKPAFFIEVKQSHKISIRQLT